MGNTFVPKYRYVHALNLNKAIEMQKQLSVMADKYIEYRAVPESAYTVAMVSECMMFLNSFKPIGQEYKKLVHDCLIKRPKFLVKDKVLMPNDEEFWQFVEKTKEMRKGVFGFTLRLMRFQLNNQ